MLELQHITETTSWDSGGGILLDILILKDGRVLAISEDSIVLYASLEDLESGDAEERQTIYL